MGKLVMLFRDIDGTEYHRTADESDIKEWAYLNECALVPLEPTEAMMRAVDGAQAAGIWPEGICRDMIAAAQGQDGEK